MESGHPADLDIDSRNLTVFEVRKYCNDVSCRRTVVSRTSVRPVLTICYFFSFDPNTGDGKAGRLDCLELLDLPGTGNERHRHRRKTPRFTTSPSFDIKMSGCREGVANIYNGDIEQRQVAQVRDTESRF